MGERASEPSSSLLRRDDTFIGSPNDIDSQRFVRNRSCIEIILIKQQVQLGPSIMASALLNTARFASTHAAPLSAGKHKIVVVGAGEAMTTGSAGQSGHLR